MKIKDLVPFRKGSDEELARRDEADPFYLFRHGMNRLFDDFLADVDRFTPVPLRVGFPGGMTPRIDVSEDEKEITITAELPGLDEKDVELLLSGETLTLKGEKKMEKEEKEKDFYRSERIYGSFCRTIPLPAGIEREKAEATFKKGILKVVLPKSVETRQNTRKIEIRKE